MRKPRDYDSELKALEQRARELRARRLAQFGELVIATGAEALDSDTLAGALLAAAESKDTAAREAWRRRGAAFFQGRTRGPARGADSRARRDTASTGGTLPLGLGPGTT